jgi:hypothetical protein
MARGQAGSVILGKFRSGRLWRIAPVRHLSYLTSNGCCRASASLANFIQTAGGAPALQPLNRDATMARGQRACVIFGGTSLSRPIICHNEDIGDETSSSLHWQANAKTTDLTVRSWNVRRPAKTLQ